MINTHKLKKICFSSTNIVEKSIMINLGLSFSKLTTQSLAHYTCTGWYLGTFLQPLSVPM